MSCMHVTVELKGAKGKYNGIPFVVGIRTVLSSYRHLSNFNTEMTMCDFLSSTPMKVIYINHFNYQTLQDKKAVQQTFQNHTILCNVLVS